MGIFRNIFIGFLSVLSPILLSSQNIDLQYDKYGDYNIPRLADWEYVQERSNDKYFVFQYKSGEVEVGISKEPQPCADEQEFNSKILILINGLPVKKEYSEQRKLSAPIAFLGLTSSYLINIKSRETGKRRFLYLPLRGNMLYEVYVTEKIQENSPGDNAIQLLSFVYLSSEPDGKANASIAAEKLKKIKPPGIVVKANSKIKDKDNELDRYRKVKTIEQNNSEDDEKIISQTNDIKVFTKKIYTSSSEQIIENNNKVRIIIPGGFLKNQEIVTISEVNNSLEIPDLFEKLVTYDISIGNLKELDTFVKIEIPFDSKILSQDYEYNLQLSITRYDEDLKLWVGIPFEINEAKNVIVFNTNHLSLYSIWKKVTQNNRFIWSGATGKKGRFRIWYNHEKVRNKTSKSPEYSVQDQFLNNIRVPDFIYKMSLSIHKILDQYEAIGFKPAIPLEIIQYSDVVDPIYLPVYKEIWNGFDDIRSDWVRYSLGHEIFHAIQYNNYYTLEDAKQEIHGGWVFKRSIVPTKHSWWLEATAEYATSRINFDNWSDIAQGHPDPKFLTFPIDWFGQPNDGAEGRRHQYEFAYFLDFIFQEFVNKGRFATKSDCFKEIFLNVSASETFRGHKIIGDPKNKLPQVIDELIGESGWFDNQFNNYSLYYSFDSDSPINKKLKNLKLHPKLSEGLFTVPSDATQEQTIPISLKSYHTAKVYTIESSKSTETDTFEILIANGKLPSSSSIYAILLPKGERAGYKIIGKFENTNSANSSIGVILNVNDKIGIIAINNSHYSNSDFNLILKKQTKKKETNKTNLDKIVINIPEKVNATDLIDVEVLIPNAEKSKIVEYEWSPCASGPDKNTAKTKIQFINSGDKPLSSNVSVWGKDASGNSITTVEKKVTVIPVIFPAPNLIPEGQESSSGPWGAHVNGLFKEQKREGHVPAKVYVALEVSWCNSDCSKKYEDWEKETQKNPNLKRKMIALNDFQGFIYQSDFKRDCRGSGYVDLGYLDCNVSGKGFVVKGCLGIQFEYNVYGTGVIEGEGSGFCKFENLGHDDSEFLKATVLEVQQKVMSYLEGIKLVPKP